MHFFTLLCTSSHFFTLLCTSLHFFALLCISRHISTLLDTYVLFLALFSHLLTILYNMSISVHRFSPLPFFFLKRCYTCLHFNTDPMSLCTLLHSSTHLKTSVHCFSIVLTFLLHTSLHLFATCTLLDYMSHVFSLFFFAPRFTPFFEKKTAVTTCLHFFFTLQCASAYFTAIYTYWHFLALLYITSLRLLHTFCGFCISLNDSLHFFNIKLEWRTLIAFVFLC